MDSIINTWDGFSFYPHGNYRFLNILINIIYDQTPDPFPYGNNWLPATLADTGINKKQPDWLAQLYSPEFYPPDSIEAVFTKKYYEASLGGLHIIGDYIVVNIPQSQIVRDTILSNYQFTLSDLARSTLRYINTRGGFKSINNHDSMVQYDHNGDGYLDFACFIIRNSHTDTNGSYGHFNENNGTASIVRDSLLFKDGNYYKFAYGLYFCSGPNSGIVDHPVTALYHEFGHTMFGDNRMHAGGGNGWIMNTGRTFLSQQGGYGLMGHSNTGMVSANGFDRWWLHWRDTAYNSTNSFIAASNQPADISKESGDKSFILRDFITTGDAIRIELPYKDEGARNQYIWLENHKIGLNEKLDYLSYSNNPCRPIGKAGIYAYYQIGKEILTGYYENVRTYGESDYLKFISAEGNYNYTRLPDSYMSCVAPAGPAPYGQRNEPNVFMGNHDAMSQFKPQHTDSLFRNNAYLLYKKKLYERGQWHENDSLPFLMDERDAFSGYKYFNISTNPAPVNTTTFYNEVTGDVIKPKKPEKNNNTIYLSGLDIQMVPLENGDYKVTVKWNNYSLKNSVNWTGKIVLQEKLFLKNTDTLLLSQNLTPSQIVKDVITGKFAPHTTFDCYEDSEFNTLNTSRVIVSERSKLHIHSGSLVCINDNSKLIVKANSELIIEECGNLAIKDGGQLVIESGGIITIMPGANIFLDGIANIDLQNGYLIGQNGIQIAMNNVLERLGTPPLKKITSNTTWTNKNYKFFETVQIEAGATLNLNNTTLNFYKSAKVEVARGAKLNLTNTSKLTSACQTEFWAGIEVWGDPALSQTPATNQGLLVINNGTIENAKSAVTLARSIPTTRGEGIPTGTGGGIIQSENAIFKNNITGVSFAPYTKDSLSFFKNCLFTKNNLYPNNDVPLEYHISLNGNVGIKILKCTFEVTGITSNNSSIGIIAYNSNFRVDGLMKNQLYQRSVFSNLDFGIYAYGSLTSRNFCVRNSVFNGCKIGVFASGILGARITENRMIQHKKNSDINFKSFGIYMEYCTNYNIQLDTIIGLDFLPGQGQYKTHSEVGICITNSGPSENMVYNNTVVGFKRGIIAHGENRSPFGTGLCIKCNYFNRNHYDIEILPLEEIPLSNLGIRRNQGSNANEITAPGGNVFSYFDVQNPHNLNIVNRYTPPINYYFHPNQNDFYVSPLKEAVIIHNSTVFLQRGTEIPYYRNLACPPKIRNNPSADVLFQNVLSFSNQMDEKQAVLNNLIDKGNTAMLVNEISTSFPTQSLELHDNLMQTSPFMSDTALIEAGRKEDVLNSALIRDIMVANPHAAKSSVVMNVLDQRANPLPETMMLEIESGIAIIGEKESLELEIDDLSQNLFDSRSLLLQTYLSSNQMDSTRWLLEQYPDPLSPLSVAWSFFDENMPDQACIRLQETDINGIASHHSTDATDFMELALIKKRLFTDSTYILFNDSITLDFLLNLSSFNHNSGIFARNLLSSLNLGFYEPHIEVNDSSLKISPINSQKHNDILKKSNLNVFPNPSDNFIIIEYNTETNANLSIFSQSGQIVSSQSIKPGYQQLLLRTAHLPSGIYIACITEAGSVHHAKFTKK